MTPRGDPAAGLPAVAAAMFLAVTLVVLGDTVGKALTAAGLHPFVIGWSRFLLALLMLAQLLGRPADNLRLSRRPALILRGAVVATGISCILIALRTEPIADVHGAFFIGPVIAYVLSLLWLRERSTLLRGVLMGIGFAGVLMVGSRGGISSRAWASRCSPGAAAGCI